MPRWHVWPSWYPAAEVIEASYEVDAADARQAAEECVELYLSDFDYAEETTVCVRPVGGSEADDTRWDVVIENIPVAIAVQVVQPPEAA